MDREALLAKADEMAKRLTSTEPLYSVKIVAENVTLDHPAFQAEAWCLDHGYRVKVTAKSEHIMPTAVTPWRFSSDGRTRNTWTFKFFHKEHAALFKLFWSDAE